MLKRDPENLKLFITLRNLLLVRMYEKQFLFYIVFTLLSLSGNSGRFTRGKATAAARAGSATKSHTCRLGLFVFP